MRDEFELSRRKMLAGIGGIGVASAGAGLGTSAYFNDTETFEDNEIVAGELDLKVDWEEHYSYPQLYGRSDPTDGLDVTRTDPDDPEYIGLPNPNDPVIWIRLDDLGPYMMGTGIEAFPDEDDDGLQDTILNREQLNGGWSSTVEEEFRAQFANVPADLDSDLRTESSRTDPLINLEDVKPGDFGEITFSFHLFDNPGYIWLTAELVEAAENEHTEPEADEIADGDEVGSSGEISEDVDNATVELLNEIRVLVWHDDGDNVLIDPDSLYKRGEEEESVEKVVWPHSGDYIGLSQEEAIVTDGLAGADSSGVLTLREFLEAASSGHGLPLDADASTEGRDCYPNSTTRYLCFAWWLPADVGNEVQSDSVAFDLGFYTEQCRHNDGSGAS